jgi:hypothetical protein
MGEGWINEAFLYVKLKILNQGSLFDRKHDSGK